MMSGRLNFVMMWLRIPAQDRASISSTGTDAVRSSGSYGETTRPVNTRSPIDDALEVLA
jgi:hypothetical protein